MNNPKPRILVLGVGNILHADEGLGVRCIELLHASYSFSDNVTLLDGGTMGLLLMGPILDLAAPGRTGPGGGLTRGARSWPAAAPRPPKRLGIA